jgi:hypothetical protein
MAPCSTLTLPDGFAGAAVAVRPSPIVTWPDGTVKLTVAGPHGYTKWARLTSPCLTCGLSVLAHLDTTV